MGRDEQILPTTYSY